MLPKLFVDRETFERHYECSEHECAVFTSPCNTEPEARAAWNAMIANAPHEPRRDIGVVTSPLLGGNGGDHAD